MRYIMPGLNLNDPKYQQYFLDNNQQWNNTLIQLKEFIDENGRRPSKHSKNQNEKV